MILKDLICRLEKEPPDKIVKYGFSFPDSYRGDYSQISFKPADNVTVKSMLEHAKSALNQTFYGYKGGEYRMTEYTECYIAKYGECGEQIGERLLSYMLDAQ